MPMQNRRELMKMAAAMGATLAWPAPVRAADAGVEDRSAFPQGVASGDPTCDSILLWTRRPPTAGRKASRLTVEVAETSDFDNMVVSGSHAIDADGDWTCRILVTGLHSDRTYWYRFRDEHGRLSRTGRTFTAPSPDAEREACFAFVSCQNVNMGYATTFLRMIAEDRARPAHEQLRFVLHLGDFIYEMLFYPEDLPGGMLQGRPMRGHVRMPEGEKIGVYHVPRGVDDYRAIYRAYLEDPDIQDARARWPFICVWDNHEFSNRGWQSVAVYDRARAAQRLRVAANQAWFEYVPARVSQPGEADPMRFRAPAVADVPLAGPIRDSAAREPNNQRAIHSLRIYRDVRWGALLHLLLTDTRSFRTQPVYEADFAAPFRRGMPPYFAPQKVVEILDAGKSFAGGNPPAEIVHGGMAIPNPAARMEAGTMLGEEQKRWFLDRLRGSTARWKFWGNSVAMTDIRADVGNLPASMATSAKLDGFAITNTHDWGGYPTERAEILGAARAAGVSNFVSLAGDRHAFCAGTVSASLCPGEFAPVAAEFVVGSIGTPTLAEAAAHAVPDDHPLRPLYLQGDDAAPAINMTVTHGVAASLQLAEDGDRSAALALRNPDVAPHLAFADMAGHGFATVRVTASAIDVEFICVPAPITDADPDPLYRVTHRVAAWAPGERPGVERLVADGPALAARFLDLDPTGREQSTSN